MQLIDSYERPISNIRVSVTSRCNLSCIYCHREGEKSPEEEISLNDLQNIFSVARDLGITSVKLTGGEPLLRKDLADIIRSIPEEMEVSLTTNATLLGERAQELTDAGLSRVNVSIDSLSRDLYKKITGKDLLSGVMDGINSALKAGLTPVKLNMVVLKDLNEPEIEKFIDFAAHDRNLVLQLIELLDVAQCPYHCDLALIEDDLLKRADRVITRRMHNRNKYSIKGAEIEVVRPLHNTTFCARCNRLRVTSDAKLKPCLLRSDNHIDIRGKQGDELRELFLLAVSKREPYSR